MFRQLDAKTGTVRWETNVRGKAPRYFFHGDVFVAPDRIIASADVETSSGAEAGVHAFDRTTGRELWKHRAGHGVLGAVVGSGRRVFAYTASGDLIALSLDSGKPEWTRTVKPSGWESPGIAGSRVFAGSSDGVMSAFHSGTGRVEWQQKLPAGITTSVRATESDVYAGTADGTMHRLSTATGEVRSSLKLDHALKPISAPLLTGNAVLVLLADQQADYRALVSLDRELRRVNWQLAAPDRWTTSRVFATGTTIFLGTPSGEVTAYCVADGSPAWSQQLAKTPIRSIGGTDETLFVGTPEGSLYAVRPPQACK